MSSQGRLTSVESAERGNAEKTNAISDLRVYANGFLVLGFMVGLLGLLAGIVVMGAISIPLALLTWTATAIGSFLLLAFARVIELLLRIEENTRNMGGN